MAENANPTVNANVKVIPAKRRATYDVPLGEGKGKLIGSVNAKDIALGSTMLNVAGRGYTAYIPKTLEAVAALNALADALYHELQEQGIEE